MAVNTGPSSINIAFETAEPRYESEIKPWVGGSPPRGYGTGKNPIITTREWS
jgi:hypothetical protein